MHGSTDAISEVTRNFLEQHTGENLIVTEAAAWAFYMTIY